MRNATGELASEELERVAGGTHSLESIPGIGPYVTVFLAIKDGLEGKLQEIKAFWGIN
jgi:hypothetical protein